MRRLLAMAIATVVVGGVSLVAQERATFVLTNGERISGAVVFHGPQRTNVVTERNQFVVRPDGRDEMGILISQVVAIEFLGGTPKTSELEALESGKQLLVKRDGATKKGKLIDMIGGDTVKWENDGGGREDMPISQVARIFLQTESARSVYNYTPSPSSPSSTSNTSARAAASAASTASGSVTRRGDTLQVVVPANRGWTDTEFTIVRNMSLNFDVSGEIRFRQRGADVTGPAGKGSPGGAGFPLPSAPVGALIGRVGNGPVFLIGAGGVQQMRGSGRLMLGVNDNAFDDNSGDYTVKVTQRR